MRHKCTSRQARASALVPAIPARRSRFLRLAQCVDREYVDEFIIINSQIKTEVSLLLHKCSTLALRERRRRTHSKVIWGQTLARDAQLALCAASVLWLTF